MKEIYTALVKAQSEIKNAVKDSVNPHFKNRYADLESVWDAVRDALHKNGLAVLQLTDIDASGAPVLLTRVIHTSGEHIEGRYPLVCKDMTDAQKLGSSTSYARRYALSAMLGVIQSDDDGNAASNVTPIQAAKPASPIQQNIAKVASPANELLAAHGKTMADIEAVVGAKQQTWTETQKAKATAILQGLKAGKPWSEAIK